MLRTLLFLIAFAFNLNDSSSFARKETGVNKLKLGIVAVGTAGFGALTYDYFNRVWWKPTKVKKFIWRDDWNDLIRADKAGHFYFSYVLSDAYKSIFKWVGFNGKTSSFFGAGISVIYEVGVVELTDGFTTRWGFSPSDAISDILGAFFPVAQEFFPSLNSVAFKWSYTPSGYTWLDYLKIGSLKDALYKKQFHTDYEGMTFWMSLDFQKFLPEKIEKFIPDFLNLAIGYSVKDINYAGRGYSEIYLALDYDLLKVNTKSDILNRIIHTLNYIHFPAPTLRIKPNVKFYYLYF
ncbi:DUF2279 domain-containing protein [Candidatus Chrysopegis kryptomonas]|uniref:Predicted lipoprotein (DUF2279) n=1 Tax=Candidatus Chryseopegocella kryptomonas TaxID=1633643 RepID=A0A0P1P0M4_9BACT|nr:DUF2279 domain-containing protein [Candidatus Chrysopegis kryptomonas]CUT04073.1 Predicted lipoprotein (DUF2279) [Candidatus Chrysopegis kryptomonas]